MIIDITSLERERILKPTSDYPPQVGMLITLLEHSRLRTMKKVAHLDIHQLDYLQDEHANSIGALLMHMAAVEYTIQGLTFRGENLQDDDSRLGKWEMPLFMGEHARQEIRGKPVDYYFTEMATVRTGTLKQFHEVDDTWLWTPTMWKRGIATNYYWLWFHVMEDEIGHCGEISWLISRIPPG